MPAWLSLFTKFLPYLEGAIQEAEPLVKTEVADGEVLIADAKKAWSDFVAAIEKIKAAYKPAS